MITIVSVLGSQGVMRFVDAFADLPFWADCVIVVVTSIVLSISLELWREKR